MVLNAGDRLGPYEIESVIGAGGMGEVFRARDTRLGREVAIKVLPSMVASDPDRLRRFEQEARATSLLNHPNILNVHDIGTQDGTPYVVYELLEGENLRSRLHSTSLNPKKAIDQALQIARGLAAAHEKGIVHRDLKPENLFITRDGHVKILDFGLAKLTQTVDSGLASSLPTSAGTEAGVIMGTAGYMSPEQVRGQIVDHRSDIFSFGAILYEMISGKRAFQGDSTVETMNAILKTDPPEIRATSIAAAPAVDRVIKHCLEKHPEDRFQSAHDLAFALETLSGLSVDSSEQRALSQKTRKFSTAAIVFVALPLLLLGIAAGYWFTKAKAAPEVIFQRLTFQPGTVYSGQFGPDGHSILYGAAWNGNPTKVYLVQPGIPESPKVNLPDADLISISKTGELLLAVGRRFTTGYVTTATLARAPFTGGVPREMLEDVQAADWNPTTGEIAIVHNVRFVEYPPGKKIYEAKDWISTLRFSPDGKMLALLEHATLGDNGGHVTVLELDGKHRALTKEFGAIMGADWHPKTNEIWFTAGGSRLQLQAVNLKGQTRSLYAIAGGALLHDISDDGDVLLSVNTSRRGISALAPGDTVERDLSWFDWSFISDISPDGKTILFMEQGEGAGDTYAIYTRDMNGSEAVRLGEGWSFQFSPSNQSHILSVSYPDNNELTLIPRGPGSPIKIAAHTIVSYEWASFVGDKKILISGREQGSGYRTYLQDIPAGKPKIVIDTHMNFPWAASPDGTNVMAMTNQQDVGIYTFDRSAPQMLPDLKGLLPVHWSKDNTVYLFNLGKVPCPVYRFNLKTRKLDLWKEFTPPDRAGIQSVGLMSFAPEVSSYAYSYRRVLSDLYLIKNIR